MRHKLFAHADASLVVGEEDYPNEAVIENDGKIISNAPRRRIRFGRREADLAQIKSSTCSR
jgi:hypothetical protein